VFTTRLVDPQRRCGVVAVALRFWHGWADLDRFLALVAAGLTGLAVGATHRSMRDLRERWQLGAVVQDMRTEFNKETQSA